MAKYKTLNRAKRCMLVLQQLALGNVPDHFKTFETVRVTGKYGTVVEFQVAKHGLRIGSDSDYVEVPLDGPAAQAAAEIYGCTLTTPWISEQIHKQAQETNGVVRFIAAPEIAKSLGIEWNPDKPDGNKMMSAEFVEKRNELLKAWREQHGISDSQLTSGYFKDIVHTSKQGRLEIYGGYYANGKRVQGRSGGFHGAGYYDYSHLGRFVRTNPKVNGTPMNISDFTNNSRYAMEFGFEKMQIGNTYDYTPALSRFVQQNKRERSASAFNLNA